mmetsp:Transcript_4745/g.12064  ORF Transcript_4745/g.12064 Transcript_4745/m.12064 type:complete len:393 (-) Transcript_4745:411-1589(-)
MASKKNQPAILTNLNDDTTAGAGAGAGVPSSSANKLSNPCAGEKRTIQTASLVATPKTKTTTAAAASMVVPTSTPSSKNRTSATTTTTTALPPTNVNLTGLSQRELIDLVQTIAQERDDLKRKLLEQQHERNDTKKKLKTKSTSKLTSTPSSAATNQPMSTPLKGPRTTTTTTTTNRPPGAKTATTIPTSAKEVSPDLKTSRGGGSVSEKEVAAFRKRIASKAVRMIKKNAHTDRKKPWTEFTEGIPKDESGELLLKELMRPYHESNMKSDTKRMTKWCFKLDSNVDDDSSEEDQDKIQTVLGTPKWIHPVKCNLQCYLAPGEYFAGFYAVAGYCQLEVKYDKPSSSVTFKIRTYLKQTGDPKDVPLPPPGLSRKEALHYGIDSIVRNIKTS